MLEAQLPPEEPTQTTEAPDTASGKPASPPPPSKLDWRLAAIVAVAVLFFLAVALNKRWYQGRSELDNQTQGVTTAGGDRGSRPAPQPMSRAEWYASLIQQCEIKAAGTIFEAGDRTFMVARPRVTVLSDEEPKRITDAKPGRLFDITRRLDGIRPEMLFRRDMPGGRGIAFMDTYPPVGVYDLEMVFKPAADATPDEVADMELVIGIQAGEEARAYPVRLANYHEVMNDTVGDMPVVITWSALAIAASAMERTLPDGTVPSFGSSGLLYQGGTVLYDIETESLWSPFERRSIAGEQTGSQLKPVQATVTVWRAWKQLHPETTVFVATKPDLGLDYHINAALPSQDYLTRQSELYPTYGFDPVATPMPPKVQVFGVTGPDGKATKAYEHTRLRFTDEKIEDTIGGEKVFLEYNPETGILTAADAAGRPLLVEGMFWFCWAGTHPETEVWQEADLREAFRLPAPAAEQGPSEQAPGDEAAVQTPSPQE